MFSFDLLLLLVIGAAIYFVIGAFWYSPLGFGKPWMKAVGLTKETMDPNHNMVKAMIISYLVCLAQTFVIMMVVSHLKVQLILYSAVIGAMIALAFGLLSAVRSDSYIKRNMTQMSIDHGYDIAGGAIIAGFVTWWLAA
ncbi:MAG: DUF1761 domain-containing protein [Candidatus Puniceispirillaceae bacterium]